MKYVATALAFFLAGTLPAEAKDLATVPDRSDTPASATLTIGDEAPALQVDHWFTGNANERDARATFKDGTVYVIEFWASWCAPCIEQMPHLAKLATP